MPGIHAPLSPSASERWMECPGSVPNPGDQVEIIDRSSEYAAEGSVAHELAERKLSHNEDLQRYVGEVYEMDGHDIVVTDDMLFELGKYIDHAQGLISKASWHQVETRVHVTEDCHGTADLMTVYQESDQWILDVTDLKFGAGHLVQPHWNSQLLIYGIGALNALEEDPIWDTPIHTVRLTVVQPRARSDAYVTTWDLPVSQLRTWEKDILMPAIEKARKVRARVAGDWCRWCPQKATCPEIAEKATKDAQLVFGDGGLDKAVAAPEDLDMDQLRAALDARELIKSWLTELEGHALSLLKAGCEVPGYKLVEGRTQRRWIDPASAEAELRKKFKVSEITETKLKSFTQIEKLGKKGKDLVDKLTTKPEGEPTIAPASDKRPAITAAPAFDAIEDAEKAMQRITNEALNGDDDTSDLF